MAADLNRASERGVAPVFARLAPDLAADDWLRIFRIWSIIAELACSRVFIFRTSYMDAVEVGEFRDRSKIRSSGKPLTAP